MIVPSDASPTILTRPPVWIRLRYAQTRRGGRAAEGDGLLNRYTDFGLYRGFESLPLRLDRQISTERTSVSRNGHFLERKWPFVRARSRHPQSRDFQARCRGQSSGSANMPGSKFCIGLYRWVEFHVLCLDRRISFRGSPDFINGYFLARRWPSFCTHNTQVRKQTLWATARP